MKLEISKEECMRLAALEGDAEVGAGLIARDPHDTLRRRLRNGIRLALKAFTAGKYPLDERVAAARKAQSENL